ncbi:Hypothetical protein FKW44_010710, partial [Caligus rogercresseyi]
HQTGSWHRRHRRWSKGISRSPGPLPWLSLPQRGGRQGSGPGDLEMLLLQRRWRQCQEP